MTIYEKVMALGPHLRELVRLSEEIDSGLRALGVMARDLDGKREEFLALDATLKARRDELADLDAKKAEIGKALTEMRARFS